MNCIILKAVGLRSLALLVLLAISVQMAVCLTEDQHASDNITVPSGSDCSCHDCGCCSLHVGFPPQAQSFTAFLIEAICPTPAPRVLVKANARIERPPRF